MNTAQNVGGLTLRRAVADDLPSAVAMYERIRHHMDDCGICIWDEIYPCELLEGDIERGELYLLTDGDELVGGFTLCGFIDCGGQVKWADDGARAVYLDRVGVSVDRLRQGAGERLVREAAALAAGRGAEYLRLFVVDINRPAIALYEKCGFERAEGVYEERFTGDDYDYSFMEYGYEKHLGQE